MPFPGNYQPNNIIQANDLIESIGAFGTFPGYVSDLDAQQKIGALWGVGYGSRGYGQTSPSFAPPAPGDTVSGTVWSNIRQALFIMAQHYNGTPTPTTTLPPPSSFNVGTTVQSHVPPNFDLPAQLTLADTNRNGFLSGPAALASCEIVFSAWTVTRASNWGIVPLATITCVVDVSWPTEDAARYFFNSGGLINLVLAQPNTGNLKSADWANIFTNKIGTIFFGINNTTWSGTWPGSPAATGYYQLTATPVVIFNGTNIGNGVYTNNDVFVSANYVATPTSLNRGARGKTIRFTIQLVDEVAGPFEQPVLGGTNVSFGYRRAVTYLSGIGVPVFSTITTF
jgi:hypothetical protein